MDKNTMMVLKYLKQYCISLQVKNVNTRYAHIKELQSVAVSSSSLP